MACWLCGFFRCVGMGDNYPQRMPGRKQWKWIRIKPRNLIEPAIKKFKARERAIQGNATGIWLSATFVLHILQTHPAKQGL